MLRYSHLKALYKVFDFSKNSGCFFFISKGFCYIRVIQEFLQNGIDYFLADVKADLLESLLRSLWILLINDIDIKIRIHLLFDDFDGTCIVLELLTTSYTSFSSSMAYIRLAYCDQFWNSWSFSHLLSLLDLLAIVVLFHWCANWIS